MVLYESNVRVVRNLYKYDNSFKGLSLLKNLQVIQVYTFEQ